MSESLNSTKSRNGKGASKAVCGDGGVLVTMDETAGLLLPASVCSGFERGSVLCVSVGCPNAIRDHGDRVNAR